ncbi:MAG: DMT family transporter [Lachnospiraceae bacterium]
MKFNKMSSKQQGILCIISAAFFFALMNLFVRLAGDLPFYEKSFFRNLVALFVSFFTIKLSGEGFSIGKGNLKYLFCRAIGGTCGIFCNFYAIDMLDISDASMLNKLSPFFSMIFSIWILKEKASVKEWLMVLTAFIGALFVVKPSFNIACLPAVVGLLGGLAAGLAYTFVRKLGQRGERGSMIVFFFSCFSTLVTIRMMLVHYEPIHLKQFIMLMLAGAAATGGQYSITAAYQKAPAKEISVFDYSQVIFAAILGFLFLDQIADFYSYIGYAIIIGVAVIRWFVTNTTQPEKLEKGGM